MATGETVQTTEAVTKKPSYLLPKFTSKLWREGLYDADHKLVGSSMIIREDDLLTFDQRLEVETRSLVFQYQLKYAEIEYELMKREFQSIEARLNQLEASDAEPPEHDFLKPVVPSKKSTKRTGKNRTKNKSSSETDEKDSSADELVSLDDKKPNKRSGKQSTKKRTDNKSGSDADKELTSSQERAHELRRSERNKFPN